MKNINKKIKYNIIFSLTIVLFFLIIFIYKINQNNKSNIIKLSEVTRSVFYSPQYVAIELGFFNDEGVSVELITSNGSDKAMTSLISGKVDIVLSGAGSGVYVYKEGKKDYPIGFAQLTKKDGNFLIGKDEKFSWENLREKKILSGRMGSMPQMVFLYIMNKKNIDVKFINNISLDSMPSAYISGLADYINFLEPAATNLAAQTESKILIPLANETEELPYTLYWSTKKYITKNEESIKKFTKAIYKAQTWINENDPKDIAKLINSYFIGENIEILTSSIQKYKELDIWAHNPVISRKSINFLKEIMTNAKELDEDIDIFKIFENKYAIEAIEK